MYESKDIGLNIDSYRSNHIQYDQKYICIYIYPGLRQQSAIALGAIYNVSFAVAVVVARVDKVVEQVVRSCQHAVHS